MGQIGKLYFYLLLVYLLTWRTICFCISLCIQHLKLSLLLLYSDLTLLHDISVVSCCIFAPLQLCPIHCWLLIQLCHLKDEKTEGSKMSPRAVVTAGICWLVP